MIFYKVQRKFTGKRTVFLTNDVGTTGCSHIHMQNNNLGLSTSHHAEMRVHTHSKWIIDLNVRLKNYKTLRKKCISENIHIPTFESGFLVWHLKHKCKNKRDKFQIQNPFLTVSSQKT